MSNASLCIQCEYVTFQQVRALAEVHDTTSILICQMLADFVTHSKGWSTD